MKRQWTKMCVALRLRRRWVKQRLRSSAYTLRRGQAVVWQHIYKAQNRIRIWITRHGAIAALILLLVMFGISAVWIPNLHGGLEVLVATEERLQGLRSLFQTLGGALLGATAIVSSLVLFSMQVNVERMPHGLFRRLSADRWLLSAFAIAFLLAILVAALSLMPDRAWMGIFTFVAAWATFLILILFRHAYRRALVLINPLRQLEIVTARTRRELRIWVRRAQRAAPLLDEPNPPTSGREEAFASKHDRARVVYFTVNASWTESAKQAVRYAISFARRYAEQGDHEVSAAAMNAIVDTNAAYVQSKGKTFFTNQSMFENPLTSDGFINDTLEHLRQSARIGISRGDEEQIEQTLRALAALVRVYAGIDYGTPRASKTHAHLAVGYMTGEIERIVPHNMPDVLMEGVRLMGQCADILLKTEGPKAIRTLVQKLGVIGCSGVVKSDYRSVTLICVEQLSRQSFGLLHIHSHDIRFVAKEIRDTMSLLAKLLLAVPDTPLSNIHGNYLAPYYSATSSQALSARLDELVNAVAKAKADDVNAQQVVDNIKDWADGLYQTEKELLLEAIKHRSHFTFDMIQWVSQVTRLLLAVSNAPACDNGNRNELRKHALYLISVLSFVPDDIETVKFVENYSMTETLFKAAMDAYSSDCPEIASDIAELLISWMLKGGRYHSGWNILEDSIYGLAMLALAAKAQSAIATLKTKVGKRLAAAGLPDQRVRDQAALEIRGRAATLHRNDYFSSSIEAGMARADHAKLKPLLEELADLISPGTTGQAARRGVA